jgi:hypothetical protein
MFILFLAMFSLDVFEPGRSPWEIAVGLLMHNIPVFVLLAVLIVAWKREIVGAIFFTLAGLLYVAIITANILTDLSKLYMVSWNFTVAGPAFVVGILFFINWRQKRRDRNISAKMK